MLEPPLGSLKGNVRGREETPNPSSPQRPSLLPRSEWAAGDSEALNRVWQAATFEPQCSLVHAMLSPLTPPPSTELHKVSLPCLLAASEAPPRQQVEPSRPR